MQYPKAIYEIEKSKEIESIWEDFNEANQLINPCTWCNREAIDNDWQIENEAHEVCQEKRNLELTELRK